MSDEEKTGFTFLVLKWTLLNAGAYFLANYDKVLGAIFTCLSIVYVCFRLWNEYLKPKKGAK